MAASDATALPVKNQAYRVTFPLRDAAGDLVAGATSLDSEISKDGGTFVDCTNEATQIATSSGMYFLDLTSTEMNADTVAIIVKSNAKTQTIVLYPQEAADVKVSVTHWNNSSVATPASAGHPVVTVKSGTGTGEINLSSGRADANIAAIGGTAGNATKLAASASTIIPGTVDNTGFTPTATEFEASDITTAAASHYVGRLVVFTSGTLAAQAARITNYTLTGGRGHFTVTTLTTAPANAVTFVVV
jgi:hypothetical protein